MYSSMYSSYIRLMTFKLYRLHSERNYYNENADVYQQSDAAVCNSPSLKPFSSILISILSFFESKE